MPATPNASFSVDLRVSMPLVPGVLGRIATAIGDTGGLIIEIVQVELRPTEVVRDLTVNCTDADHGERVQTAVAAVDGVAVELISDRTFELHRGGKIATELKSPIRSKDDLSMAYTPGVARVCLRIHDVPEEVYDWTIKANTVAVVTDGTAVLGLGDIGPEAALPVMEGKAMLFKSFAGVDAFPICLATTDVDEIVETVERIAPVFGGINLEDISAPRCFEVENRLKASLSIPVFHDDQHGTAVVVLAAILNACRLTGKRLSDLRVAMLGVGAAGVACTKILQAAGVAEVIGADRRGTIYRGRTDGMNSMKEWYAEHTNAEGRRGTVSDAMRGADVFIGLSGPGLVTLDDVRRMAPDPIVFAMANPTPEILPEEAAGHVAVMATGRSDYPNQINNVLAFPGIFRGALDARAREITEAMKVAAAEAIAGVVGDDLAADQIIPSPFDRRVPAAVAAAVAGAATPH